MNSGLAAREIGNLVRNLRKQHMGKGPDEVVTRFSGPLVICEMKGCMTNFEKFMAQTPEGKQMIHTARTAFVKRMYEDPALRAQLERIVNAKFIKIYADFCVDTDSAISVFVFQSSLGTGQ
ncbi:MAG: hypothetical protein JWN15_3012 [Firmicutes bacterium]|nr:hypothetical protein [Bacillota bacterium]